MTDVLPDGLAARWYDYWRRVSGSRTERLALEAGEPADVRAAEEWVRERVCDGGVAAVHVLAALAEVAPEGDDGATVGIGPVEDLFYIHGNEIVDLVVDAARRRPRFARALMHVSLATGTLSAASLAKLDRFKRT